MTYHILYNPAANNALVGLSDTLPTIPEGMAVKARPGDMPDMDDVSGRLSSVTESSAINTGYQP